MASNACEVQPPAAAPVAGNPQGTATDETSYGQILKSSTLIGGSSVLNVGIRIVRSKAMAMLLGPAGFGLFALFGSISNLAQSVAGMGVNSSGVRQIAEAAGSHDANRIAMTTVVLRKTSVILGILGAGLLLIFSPQISRLTFGNALHTRGVCFLALAVVFTVVSGGQGALIQGMRRIADLAKMDVLGAAFGTILAIPIVYFFRDKGVVPSLIGFAATSILVSWWYSRKIHIRKPEMAFSEIRHEFNSLLKLGFAFMSSGLVLIGSGYAIRVIVLRKIGYEGTGFYQCAWTLGGLYVGFILQAMAADFYPRLTASAKEHATCNRLVNEQALIGLLLAGPGAIATLTFAPIIISLLYSAKFVAAATVLRWMCLGAMLQVITWPMGFIIVAKARAGLLIFCEIAWGVVSIALAWVCVGAFGLDGAGIAFFGSYVFHLCLIYPIVRRLTGFRWSSENVRGSLIYVSLITTVFGAFYLLPDFVATSLGTLAVLVTATYSVRTLVKLSHLGEGGYPMHKLAARFASALLPHSE